MLIFSVFLFTVKSKKPISNYLLGTMLLFVAFDLSGFFVGEWFEEHQTLNIFKIASSLLQMPLFYLYMRSVCFASFKLRPIHLLHAILFLAFLVIFKITFLSNESYRLFEVIGEVQWFAYVIAEFMILKKYKIVHLENYAHPNSKAYKWLFQFLVLSCIAHSFVFVKSCLSYLNYTTFILDINIVISISTLVITTWFVFKALYYPELFTGMQTELQPIKTAISKIKNTSLDANRFQKDNEELTSYMVTQKPYLDFELTLQKLASQLDMPEKELSMLINHHMGKHFFDFINEYRIEEAKTILANPEEKELTILEVLYQVGFNSKSSFYTAFKKVAGITPTAYRKGRLSS